MASSKKQFPKQNRIGRNYKSASTVRKSLRNAIKKKVLPVLNKSEQKINKISILNRLNQKITHIQKETGSSPDHVMQCNSLVELRNLKDEFCHIPYNLAIVRQDETLVQQCNSILKEIIHHFGDIPFIEDEVIEAGNVTSTIMSVFQPLFDSDPSFFGSGKKNTRKKRFDLLVQNIIDCAKTAVTMARVYNQSARDLPWEKVPILFTFEGIDQDGCERFHQDWNMYRMLCTYLGPSTEYILNRDVNRDVLNQSYQRNEDIVKGFPHSIHSTPTGSVLLLKGNDFPNNEGNSIVHRSPKISSESKIRVLLKIDIVPVTQNFPSS